MKKHEELPEDHVDPLMQYLHHAIRFAIKILAVLMVLVIFWSIADQRERLSLATIKKYRSSDCCHWRKRWCCDDEYRYY